MKRKPNEIQCVSLLPENFLPVRDRANMGFKGTFVTSGRATAFVVETGMRTELGQIAKMIQIGDRNTPLQKN